jgi:hypothetical protein
VLMLSSLWCCAWVWFSSYFLCLGFIEICRSVGLLFSSDLEKCYSSVFRFIFFILHLFLLP